MPFEQLPPTGNYYPGVPTYDQAMQALWRTPTCQGAIAKAKCDVSPRALKLVQFAYEELGLLHHVACLAGKHSPRPSEVLKAAGLGPLDANFGPIFLAEHVPEAA